MYYSKILYALVLIFLITGCIDNQEHIESRSDLGLDGVMPVIGKIYIDNVEVVHDEYEGTEDDMLKAHHKYELSADIIVHDYSILEGGFCEWTSFDNGTTFDETHTTTAKIPLHLNKETNTYECSPVYADFKKDGSKDKKYIANTHIRVQYIDKDGNYIYQTDGSTTPYSVRSILNVADRHNIIHMITSRNTVLFHRKDGFFQSGYTAYRGMLGLQQKIGSAIYEGYIKSPGGTKEVRYSFDTYDFEQAVIDDQSRMDYWLNVGKKDDSKGIYSESAFVSNYGPPIALPAFRKGNINYKRVRSFMLRHSKFPIIIGEDKRAYAMGQVTNFSDVDIKENYNGDIKANDIWFAYSGIDIGDNPDITKFHVGQIQTRTGVEPKFVSNVEYVNDLDTTILLNEADREYYMVGNPVYNTGFCANKGTFDNSTYIFTYNVPCKEYDPDGFKGARKLVGLQKLIGSGDTAISTDTAIYFIGADGRGYMVNLKLSGINGDNIMNGSPLVKEPIQVPHTEGNHIHTEEDWRNDLYVVDFGFANLNQHITPTLLLKDGSVVFIYRAYENGKIVFKSKHFYVNKNKNINEPKHKDNIKIVKLLGPTLGYGENGKLYYWTDAPALGISYKPTNTELDDDYIAISYNDPTQLLEYIPEDARKDIYKFHYDELQINESITRFDTNDKLDHFAILPYNPVTATEYVVVNKDDGIYTLEETANRSFRTNAHLVVNLNKQADFNYILIPYYFYGMDTAQRVRPKDWIMKKNGVLAAEAKGYSVSKIFGKMFNEIDDQYSSFRFSAYGRDTIFFANKKGIYSFVSYNTRKTKEACQDGDLCSNFKYLGESVPDFFYTAKSNTYLEEASGKNKYLSTPFASDIRMANFPDIKDYARSGFEPQLLSNGLAFEFLNDINDPGEKKASQPIYAGYVSQFWFETIKNRFDNLKNITAYDFFKDLPYQYKYGYGLYRYYDNTAFPVWRSRKTNIEALANQTRYGTIIPLARGDTASSYYENMVDMFLKGPLLDQVDTKNYVSPRDYVHALYAIYDRDLLKEKKDLSTSFFGNLNKPMSASEIRENGIGYIMDTGNFMWKNMEPAVTGTGLIPLDQFDFVIYH